MKNCYNLPSQIFYCLLSSLFGLTFGFQIVAQTDAEIVEIIFPQEGLNCDGGSTITPKFVLENSGNTNIDSLMFAVTLDGIEITTNTIYDIPVGQDITVFLESIAVDVGQHSLTLEIIEVNGMPDNNPNNNTETIDFERAPGMGVMLNLLTDNYGQEISLEIENENGQSIIDIGQNSFESATQYNEPYCLGEGCYTFNIFDAANDGICCGFGVGAYSLTNFYGEVIIEGGNYGSGESFDFCLEAITDFLNYDISISTQDSQTDICESYEPFFFFTNLGFEEVNNLTIEYNLEGETVETFEWSGNVPQFNTEIIALPPYVDLLPNNYNLNINIVSINGEIDENTEDNEGSIAFEIVNGATINIIPYSSSPYTTIFYSVEDDNGNTVVNNQPVFNNIIELECLPIGCYTLFVEDSFENGDADFVIENSLGIVIAEIEPPFGTQASVDFCNTPLDLPQFDAGITAILEPANTLCNTEISPSFEFFNYGLETITEIVLEYTYDDTLTLEETWTGTIFTYDRISINLPSLENFDIGDHDISVNVLSFNGQTDGETLNNSLAQSFTISDAESYTLNFTAGFAPQENSYQITDENEDILFSGTPGTFDNPFGTTTRELCIYPGCYTLTLLDATENGGAIISITDGDDATLTEGTSEGTELVLDFCIEGPEEVIEEVEIIEGINDLPESAQIELFPNPSTGMFYLDHQLEGTYQVKIHDLLGRNVFSQSLITGENTIDLSGAANGVYLLSIENETERGVYKITLIK